MKLIKVIFNDSGFRNLKDIVIDIAPRLTVIAGHNGIGKSTILGLIANGSEYTKQKTLLNKSFRSDFSEIFFLDYNGDFSLRNPAPSTAELVYNVDGTEVTKECEVSGTQKTIIKKKNFRKFMIKVDISTLTEKQKEGLGDDDLYVYRMRVIPRTKGSFDKEFLNKHSIGTAAKIKIPTLYLGMSRISPIGEFDWSDIEHKIQSISLENSKFIYEFFNKVIPFNYADSENKVYSHSFTKNNKQSYVPEFGHSSLTISLGQDSLSSIATALASFENLKNLMRENYQGGILIIDEIEAGLHPKAQKNLIGELKRYCKDLSLQIIVTSHSLTIIKEILDESIPQDRRVNNVIYLMDTNVPTIMKNPSYLKIKNDMLLEPFKVLENNVDTVHLPPEIYVYFEDLEALDFFKGILLYKKISDNFGYFGKDLNFVAAKLGCTNLIAMNKTPHFQSSVIILDSDMLEGDNKNIKNALKSSKNVVLLPSIDTSSKYYGLPPDKIIYLFLMQKYTEVTTNRKFWQTDTPHWFTTNYYVERIKDINRFYTSKHIPTPTTIDDVRSIDRKAMKQWYNGVKDDLMRSNIYSLWASENETECQSFLESVVRAVSNIR